MRRRRLSTEAAISTTSSGKYGTRSFSTSRTREACWWKSRRTSWKFSGVNGSGANAGSSERRSQRQVQLGGAPPERGGGIEIDAQMVSRHLVRPAARRAPADSPAQRWRFLETAAEQRSRSSGPALRSSISNRRLRWRTKPCSIARVTRFGLGRDGSSSIEPANGGIRSKVVFSVRYRPISRVRIHARLQATEQFQDEAVAEKESKYCFAPPRLRRTGNGISADPRISWKALPRTPRMLRRDARAARA